VPLVALTIACLAAVTGGRFLSGLAGQVELEAYSGAAWFERLIVRPGDLARSAGEAILPPGSDADIFARFTAAEFSFCRRWSRFSGSIATAGCSKSFAPAVRRWLAGCARTKG